jgi:hypothetical protein
MRRLNDAQGAREATPEKWRRELLFKKEADATRMR